MTVLAAIIATFAAGGCSTKQDDAGSPRAGGAGIGEEGLAGSSSIDQWEETGTVAAGGVFRDVRFGFDSDGLEPGAREVISHNAVILRADAARRIEIEGHCDERGSSEYNLALGARRARSTSTGPTTSTTPPASATSGPTRPRRPPSAAWRCEAST